MAYSVGDDGVTYTVDGIDDKLSTISNLDDEGQSYSPFKLTSTCIDDDSSSWLPSYGDVNRYDFSSTRLINMDGFVHTAEGYSKFCSIPANNCTGGQFTDLTGQRAMGYYDQGLSELLLLHGVAVRGFGPLVFARGQRERSQPHRNHDRRDDAGSGA